MSQLNPLPTMDKPAPISPARQLSVTVAGELMGLAVSVGSVYAADYAAPQQTRALVDRLAGRLAQHRGTDSASQQAAARKIADFTIMNVCGLANMATQFFLHRQAQDPAQRLSLRHELGRVLTGRVAGTATAGMALMLSEHPALREANRFAHPFAGMNGHQARLGELVASSLIQSAGAIPGNAAAQLLYDRTLGTAKAHQR